ncbi:hypothetical protein OHU17_02240 [Streptomyces goshikiensis]|uniref:Uncharacterized protein n=1 Tax=Streptomyces goshikiensis TaxID=1942 RepID=A0ABZ1RDY9_9ACTN|nr:MULTISPECIES: hypothetical protein [Streptomyces]EDX21591.1 hypothetical protein SSAG_01382 [Streptomyces sp. Mg1]RPK32606.1 hypothetical protein EES37_33260 [Streptomyces sp. ADI91-18]WBY23818.1 hypothetical protein PET44_31580 [Streptomyces goshikiensis]WSS02725.1 hypothetical protein OG224_34210 [Streptomyces goshikiensis]WSX96049.1 hypothetical protein OG590_01815 [Streptomyces goshikiensis]
MADVLLKVVLVCAVLGAFWGALASSGVGRMRHGDILELRRQQRFRHVLDRNVQATWPSYPEVPLAAVPVREPVGATTCAACGALSGPGGGVAG